MKENPKESHDFEEGSCCIRSSRLFCSPTQRGRAVFSDRRVGGAIVMETCTGGGDIHQPEARNGKKP